MSAVRPWENGSRARPTRRWKSCWLCVPYGINLVRCINIICSQPYKSRKGPKYALFGVSGYTPFWGPHNNLLGWYADEASVNAEISAIQEAMRQGEADYTLQYNVQVRKKLGRIEMIDE